MKETKFKQTEVGMIPSDWDETSLNLIVDFYNGDRGVNYPKDSDFCDVGIPFINAGHLKKCQIDFSDMDYITRSHYKKLGGAKIKKDDILFCLRGSLGKYAYVNFDDAAPASSLCVLRSKKIDSKFLYQLLGSEYVKSQIVDANSGSSQPNLSAKDVGLFNIVLPSSITEQQRIAETLSDVDTLIANLEKLIAKKKNIKQGAMQQLLTGRKRLPAFVPKQTRENLKMTELGPIPSDWDVKLLGNVYRFKYGIFNNNPDNGGPYPVYGANGIIGGFTSYNAEDSVVIGHIGTAGTVIWAEGKHFVTYNGTIAEIKDKSENDSLFGYYQLIRLDIPSICNGSSQPFLAYDKLNVLKIVMPSSKEEQTAIANIISDMDSEIQTLETKLAKYRKLKTGMMQQLLTGKIRLV